MDQRIWLDIPSVEKWRNLVEKMWLSEAEAKTNLTTLIAQYHLQPKTKKKELPHRADRLNEIVEQAKSYFTNHDPENPLVQALKNRAESKASYLKILERYYNNAKEKYRDPRMLVDFITKTPQKVADGLYALVPGVRMEKLDPIHRNFEFMIRNNGSIHPEGELSEAFAQWVDEVVRFQDTPPFFLWLEDHPICTDGKLKKYEDIKAMQYGTKGNTTIHMVVPLEGLLRSVSLNLLGRHRNKSQVFDTSDYPETKLPNGAAYVWSREREIFAGPHGILHHSSLDSGRKVRCAGMIEVRQGKVQKINTDSGHYRPPLEALVDMIHELRFLGVFAPNAVAGIFHPSPQDYPEPWEYVPIKTLLQRVRPERPARLGNHRQPPPRVGNHRQR